MIFNNKGLLLLATLGWGAYLCLYNHCLPGFVLSQDVFSNFDKHVIDNNLTENKTDTTDEQG
jgi:hypothetical protein